jgi:hypothetical protein
MIGCDRLIRVVAIALAMSLASQASAALLLYEPFDYPEDRFLLATTPGAGPNSTTSPIGHLAPNNNNWYGTGIAAATNYQVANDGQVTSVDLTVPGLYKPNATKSLSLGTTGHTMRLSLNTSIGPSNQTAINALDKPYSRAGTDATLQASDTGGTGYYSIALRVTDITGLNAPGGVLLGFNNLINAQTGNPATVGAGLSIRPKPAGNAGEFELGIVDQAASGFTSATWDTTSTFTAGPNSDTIFVVGKYQTVGPYNTGVAPIPTDDIALLWVNPSPSTFGGFEPAGAIVNNSTNPDIPTNAGTNNHTLQSFLLRQTGAVANNQIPVGVIYDELRVGTTWRDVTPIPEPSTATLVALLGGMLCGFRRRS